MRLMQVFMQAVVIIACAAASSCSDAPEPEVNVKRSGLYSASFVDRFTLKYPTRTDSERRGRLKAVAEVLAGKSLTFGTSEKVAAKWDAPFSNEPKVVARYRPETDQILLFDRHIFSGSAVPNDIGEAKALTVFKATLKALEVKAIIAKGVYNADTARKSIRRRRIYTGAGDSYQDYAVSYTYIVERRINEIIVPQSTVVVEVHASGAVALIRVGGPEAVSTLVGGIEKPAPSSNGLAPALSATTLKARLKQDVGGGPTRKVDVVSQELAYVLPYGKTKDVVDPRLCFRYRTYTGEVGSRLDFACYSVIDSMSSPVFPFRPQVMPSTPLPTSTK